MAHNRATTKSRRTVLRVMRAYIRQRGSIYTILYLIIYIYMLSDVYDRRNGGTLKLPESSSRDVDSRYYVNVLNLD